MARVWYCRNCGYEVYSRGRCHACGEKLISSGLAELEMGSDDDEVGYEIDGWADRDRGRLIERLNNLGVAHRFEGDELVVDASDEERVDDLVASLGDGAWSDDDGEGRLEDEPAGPDVTDGAHDHDLDRSARLPAAEGAATAADDPGGPGEAIGLLRSAAGRLRADPTDMQADADLAEASTAVFLFDRFGPLDEDQWSAVGRVTRSLLSLLGAEEALDEQIGHQAAVLEKLLSPIGDGSPGDGSPGDGSSSYDGEWTEYDLGGWTPEQVAELSLLLDGDAVPYRWEGTDLLVPVEREEAVEDLFDRVAGVPGADDGDEPDEERYQAIAELFAASGRLAADPADRNRRAAVLEWVGAVDGPPLLGMDEALWLRIRSRARSVAEALEDASTVRIGEEAAELHDVLRAVV